MGARARLIRSLGVLGALTALSAASTAATPRVPPHELAAGTTFEGCPVFPDSNPWNKDISKAPVHPNSADFIKSISNSDGKRFLHADFGEDPSYGIPFDVVPADQPAVPITYTAYGDESDKGQFPIPPDAGIEGGSDDHVIVVQQET